jgi:hypothetical protein
VHPLEAALQAPTALHKYSVMIAEAVTSLKKRGDSPCEIFLNYIRTYFKVGAKRMY